MTSRWALALALIAATVAPAVADDDLDPGRPRDAKKAKKAKKAWRIEAPTLSGFLQVHYRLAFNTADDAVTDYQNVRVQRVRIALEGKVRPWLAYDISIDPRAPELRGVLRDAYLSISRVIPRHAIRIGQQKTQFGYEGPESSTRLFAVNRSEMTDNLTAGINHRDVGIGLIGRVPLGGGVRIEDAITVVNGAGLNAQADDTARKNVFGRVGLRYRRDDAIVRVGVSGAWGDYLDPNEPADPADDERVEFTTGGADLQLDHPWVFASAEAVFSQRTIDGEDDDLLGYYANLVVKTPCELGPLIRFDALGDEYRRVTFGGYYGAADAPVRVLINYEYRQLKDGVRGDDKLYLWTQVRF